MIGVFFIATDWGRSSGGINSINDSLIKSLSKIVIDDEMNWKLYCIIKNRMYNDEESEIEERYNIKIITTDTPTTSRKLKKEINNNNFDQLFFIGHDIITGEHANKLRDNYERSTSIVFHHMNYEQYYFLRNPNPEQIRNKVDMQKSIITEADIIVPIGPFLKDSAHDLCVNAKINPSRIVEMIPGLEDITPIEDIHANHKIILFGRLEDENNYVKQIQLALAGIAMYIKETGSNNIIIKCYGYEKDSSVNQKNLMSMVSNIAGQTIPITANSYIRDEKELFNEIVTSSLCIMPSYYEGFGLTAYEAIAAGVPVIISENTGLYSFLSNWSGSVISGLYETIKVSANPINSEMPYTEQDLKNMVSCLKNIFNNYDLSKKKALQLRQVLLEGQCTWEYAAISFCNMIKSSMQPIKVTEVDFNPSRNINVRETIGLNEFISEKMISKYCSPFCNTEELVCKIIRYSNDRKTRITIWSSDDIDHSKSFIFNKRSIDDGTVGILNKYVKKDILSFPIIISNFSTNECLLVTNDSVVKISDNNMGVPDHQVLSIIAVPLIHNNILVGALTFEIYDKEIIKKASINEKEFVLNSIYQNLKAFSEILVCEFYYNAIDNIFFCEAAEMSNNKSLSTLKNRELVSFSGRCPLNCKHCFASEFVDVGESENNVSDIISSLMGKNFDVVYISHYRENFYNQEKGVLLCEEIYDKFKCDICVTTRCVLSDEYINRIIKLNSKMKNTGNNITFCISVPAMNSYVKIEDSSIIATPIQRIGFAEKLHNEGVKSIVTIRPLFPASYISLEEIHNIVDQCENKVDAIITGGLCANDNILKRLGICKENIKYLSESDSEYLIGVKEQFNQIDVTSEINDLQSYCKTKGIPFFKHSMEALNHLKNQTEFDNASR